MTAYGWCLLALALSLATTAVAATLAFDLGLRRQPAERPLCLALTAGSLLLALQNAYALDRTLHTGLYDLRQAILALLAGLCYALAIHALRRRRS